MEKKSKMEIWPSEWFGWCEKLNGRPVLVTDKDSEWDKYCGWKRMQVFGYPLVDIKDETILKTKIVDPLLKLIEPDQNDKK